MTHIAAAALLAALCAQAPSGAAPGPRGGASAADDRAFLSSTEEELRRLSLRANTADWVSKTFITYDTERLVAWANEDVMELLSRAVRQSLAFRETPLDPSTRRQIDLLRLVTEPPPAPRGTAELQPGEPLSAVDSALEARRTSSRSSRRCRPPRRAPSTASAR